MDVLDLGNLKRKGWTSQNPPYEVHAEAIKSGPIHRNMYLCKFDF
jgi:hypothetical protein